MMDYIKQQILTRIAYFLLRLILLTCRFHLEGFKSFQEKVSGNSGIVALWHDRLLLMPYIAARITPDVHYNALISNSRDGKLLSSLTASFANGHVISVPHDQKAIALKKTLQTLKDGKVIILTPDGPKGPACEIKEGLPFAAAASGAPVFALNWVSNRYWQLPTWDKMRIPKPFSKIHIKVFAPLYFRDRKNCESETKELSKQLTCNISELSE